MASHLDDLVPLEKAAERLRMNRTSLWRKVGALRVTVYRNPRDGRQKLLSWNELELALRPHPMGAPPRADPDRT